MRKDRAMKKMAAVALAASMVFTMAESVSASAYKTVNGVTEGDYEVSTDDIGSASFNVEGNHVEMTNFAFDADEALLVEAEINEEDLVYTHVYVHDEEYNIMQNIADGHYPEVFTEDNAAEALNTIYKTVFGATDEPVTNEILSIDTGVIIAQLYLTDGQMFMFAKEGTDQYEVVAVTTEEYGSQDIINAAFDSLAGEADAEETAEE